MKRSAGLRRTPFTIRLLEDGTPRFSSFPPRSRELPRGTGFKPSLAVVERDGAVVIAPREWRRPARTETGFSRSVRLAVRKRAGGGDIEQACCEACGRWLGRYGGQVHHIIGRGMGGCKDEIINSPAGAALLCGTPLDGCHGLATAFDEEIGERGFWLPRGTDPRLVPMMLASEHGSGVLAWRTVEGGYLFEAPDGSGAA